MNPDLFVFAFKGTIAERVLSTMNLASAYFLDSNIDALDALVLRTSREAPAFVIGMGQYTGRDNDRLRIETMCSNQFRNGHIGGTRQELRMHDFLLPGPSSKVATGIGNSWCNAISFQMISMIRIHKLTTRYAFIHIPKAFPVKDAVLELLSMIESIPMPDSSVRTGRRAL